MINLWAFLERLRLNPYPLIRPFLFCLDPEVAHESTLKILGLGLGPRFFGPDEAILQTKVCGIDFPNPVGLAAGLDKQATRMDAFMGFGFGAVEIGSVTPKPQPGNPRPRMFRVSAEKALINRFGFNSVGADVFAERMKAWRAKAKRTHYPVGINLGKNKETEDDAADYVLGIEKLATLGDFVTVNISSPNTPGLRDLQGRARMAELLARVMEARARFAPNVPLFVKVAPDLDEAQQADIAAVILESGVQGLIIGNTTISRPSSIPVQLAKEAGGLSGKPLREMSTKILSNFYRLTEGKIPLVGCGGIESGADAYAKIRAGASLVQVYTALVYEGPMVIQKIKRELAELLRRDGFKSVADAVGADHR